jgi:uncharacterized membrane protein
MNTREIIQIVLCAFGVLFASWILTFACTLAYCRSSNVAGCKTRHNILMLSYELWAYLLVVIVSLVGFALAISKCRKRHDAGVKPGSAGLENDVVRIL